MVPFSTRSGAVPDYLLGRDQVINSLRLSFDDPQGNEYGNLLLVGLRGIGKTVMLTEAGRLAREKNWLVVDSYLTEEGLLRRIGHGINAHLGSKRKSHTSFGISIPPFSSTAQIDREEPELNLVDRIEHLLSNTRAPGLLITVDEVHATAGKAQTELREYGNEIQLAHRRGLPVMSIMAGLPGGINALLKDEDKDNKRTGATFLRRAAKESLGAIDDEEIWNAYAAAAAMSGKLASAQVLDMLTSAARGYPYLFQLIGQRVWHSSDSVITVEAAHEGIRSAIRRLGDAVLDTSLNDLSALDKSFLLAMAQDDGPARMQDIAARMNISSSQATNYKNRLIAAEVIVGDFGYAEFALPYLKEHLREHYASTMDFAPERRVISERKP